MPEPQWSPYKYPELDVKEYNKKLEALLWRRFYAGQLDVDGKRLKPNEKNVDKATNYINNIVRQTISEGVNPRLPFYNEVITATMTPEWYQGQVGQYAQDWQRYGEEQAQTKERDWAREFGVQQYEQSEAWRRYGAETQQQRWKAEQEYKKSQAYLGLMRQREETRTAKYNWGQQRFAQQFGGGQQEWQVADPTQYGSNLPQPQQQAMAQAWGDWNSRLASGASWPQSEFLKQAVNPYEPKREGRWDEVQELESDLAETKIRADAIRSRFKDPNDILTQAGDFTPETPEQQSAFGTLMREAVLERELKRAEKQATSDVGPGEERISGEERLAQKFPSVKTPAFLRKAYPELGAELPHKGMWEGQGFKPPMHPLSGQQWGQMSPSQRGKWGGYIGWAGGKPEDLYAQMQKMTPQYRAGTRWSPARQG